MIFLNINNDFSKSLIDNVNNGEMQSVTTEERMQLIAKATLDRRLNARDLKLYNYIICCEYLGFTQEEISELLDLSRSNINKSFEKLASFNYIEKKEIKVEGETKKRMSYIPRKLTQAGFINCNTHDIIRVLNVSNVSDSNLKYTYCSQQDFRDYELSIDGYKADIDTIERCYESESEHTRKKAYDLIEVFSPMLKDKEDALKNIRKHIADIKKKIDDTKSMRRKLTQFSQRLKSNILGDEAVQKVLTNEDAKLILFLDRAEDENFKNFKEKYLEDYIRFVCAFSDLSENEDFFRLYYENKKIEMSMTEVIKMLGFTHREVPHKRQGAINYIKLSFEKFLEKIDKSKLTEKAKSLLNEIEILANEGIVSDAVYNAKEITLILCITESKNFIKPALGLSFDAFEELYNLGLLDTMKELVRAKKDNEPDKEIKGDKLLRLLENELYNKSIED